MSHRAIADPLGFQKFQDLAVSEGGIGAAVATPLGRPV
jgi:hypothetical protein